jgi:hypothetical protein
MAVGPIVFFKDLVGHAGDGDQRGVGVSVGRHAEDAAEVEDDGARYSWCGGGRGGIRHLSIITSLLSPLWYHLSGITSLVSPLWYL